MVFFVRIWGKKPRVAAIVSSIASILLSHSTVPVKASEPELCWPVIASRTTTKEAFDYIRDGSSDGGLRVFRTQNGVYAITKAQMNLNDFVSNQNGGYITSEAFCSKGRTFHEIYPQKVDLSFQAGVHLPPDYGRAIDVFKVIGPTAFGPELFFPAKHFRSSETVPFPSEFTHANMLIYSKEGNKIHGDIQAPPYYLIEPVPFTGKIEDDKITLNHNGLTTVFEYDGIYTYTHDMQMTWAEPAGNRLQKLINRQFSEHRLWFNHGNCMPFAPPLTVTPSEALGDTKMSSAIASAVESRAHMSVSSEPTYYGLSVGLIDGEGLTPNSEYEIAKVLRQDSRFRYVDLFPLGDCGGADNSIIFMERKPFFSNDGRFYFDAWVDEIDETLVGVLSSDTHRVELKNRQTSHTDGYSWGNYSVYVVSDSERSRGISGYWDAFRLDFLALNTIQEAQGELSVLFGVEDFRTIKKGYGSEVSPPSDIHFLQNTAVSQFGQYISVEYDVMRVVMRDMAEHWKTRCHAVVIDADKINCR